jgi:GPI mannosyltransferase 2
MNAARVFDWLLLTVARSSDVELFATTVVIKFVFIGWCVLSHVIVADHVPTGAEQWSTPTWDASPWTTRALLEPFFRWDAIHFTRIALEGYTIDAQRAFFPLWPWLLRRVAHMVAAILTIDNLVGMGVVVNVLLHACSTLLLKWILTALAPALPKLPTISVAGAVLVHMLSPASIFFTAAYSESLFCCLKWLGVYLLQIKRHPRPVLGTLCLVLASMTRSNGSLSVGLAVSSSLLCLIPLFWMKVRIDIVQGAVATILTSLLIVVPTLLWSVVSFQSVCRTEQVWQWQRLFPFLLPESHLEGNMPVYCDQLSPISFYSKLQEVYWNVGLFRFYQWRQFPNLMLGLPPLLISIRLLYTTSLPLLRSLCEGSWPSRERNAQSLLLALQIDLLLHLLVVIGFAHVNIATRLLASSSPLFALSLFDCCQSDHKWWRRGAWIYWIGFLVLGTALHTNFFPLT